MENRPASHIHWFKIRQKRPRAEKRIYANRVPLAIYEGVELNVSFHHTIQVVGEANSKCSACSGRGEASAWRWGAGRGVLGLGGVGDFCTTTGGAGGWAGRKNGFDPPRRLYSGSGGAPCPCLKGFVLNGVVTSAGGGGSEKRPRRTSNGSRRSRWRWRSRVEGIASPRLESNLTASSSFSSASIRAFWGSCLFLSSPSRAIRASSSGSTSVGVGVAARVLRVLQQELEGRVQGGAVKVQAIE